VQIDGLSTADIAVEVVYGHAGHGDDLEDVHTIELAVKTPGTANSARLEADSANADSANAEPAQAEPEENALTGSGPALFAGTLELSRAGAFGYTVRVVPKHRALASAAELGLIAVAH
jgi:starch phosphorylase